MTDPEATRLLTAAREIIAGNHDCFAISLGEGGEVNARIVVPLAFGRDWSVSFITSAASRKAAEIDRGGRLTLAFQNHAERAYVTLVGRASIGTDAALKRRLWHDDLGLWFRGGVEDPDVAVVQMQAERIELWSQPRGIMPANGCRAAMVGRDGDGWRVLQA